MGRQNSMQMAGRDPALAARLGILPQGGPRGNYGADFGNWGPGYGFGGHYGFGFGVDPSTASPMAVPGAPTAGAPAAALAVHQQAAQHLANPHHPAMQHATQAILNDHYSKKAKTAARLDVITPNAGSEVDIQRYDFSINASPGPTIGVSAANSQIAGMSLQPSTTIRPQRCTFNAPTFAFVMVQNILVGNVNGMVGGQADAFNYGPASMGVHLDLPSINPSNRIQVQATYTGLVPPVYGVGFVYPFTASFQCPATTVPNPSLQV